jgi:uncharacterized phage protein gp47/JayE
MTTSFQDRWPTFTTLATEVATRILGQRPSAGMGPGTDGATLRDALAHVAYGLHLHLRYGVLHNLIPTSASGIYLDAWAYLFGLADGDRDNPGFGRIKARACLTSDAIQVTATGATGDLNGEQFSDGSGTIYKINETYTFGGAGSAILDIIGVDVGDITNIKLTDSETLTWVSTPANMSETITQKKDFSGGADKETDAALRDRLREKLQTPPQGGNWSNWKDWIEDTSPGELNAYVFPKRQYSNSDGYGYGTVDYCAFLALESGADRYIQSTDQIWDDIETQIEAKAPVLLLRNSRQLTISSTLQDIDLTLEMANNATEAQLCDWDAESVKTTVASTTVSTRLVECTANVCSPTVTNGIKVGHRVIINEVEAIVSEVNVGTDPKDFKVEDWPSEWGSADDVINGLYVMSGGGVILTTIIALRDMGDGIGPAKWFAAPIPGWDDTLRHASIKSAVIQSADGAVVDMTVTTPAADVAPTYDDNSDVDAITLDEIRVWESK